MRKSTSFSPAEWSFAPLTLSSSRIAYSENQDREGTHFSRAACPAEHPGFRRGQALYINMRTALSGASLRSTHESPPGCAQQEAEIVPARTLLV
jgi:hypothetical protein